MEQENTQEREAVSSTARETVKPLQDKTWKLAHMTIVRRHYIPDDDVKKAYYLTRYKFPNVNTIAKDSCFHFGYMNKKEGDEDEDDKCV